LLWQELLSANYASQVITVHYPVKEGILLKHGLRDEQVAVVANFPDDNLFQLKKSFSIDSGLRLVETLSLSKKQVDLDNLVIRVKGKGNKERELPNGDTRRRVRVRGCAILDEPAGSGQLPIDFLSRLKRQWSAME
jgi:site-specific recombinase XerC